jgi:hypothetical protein
MKTSANSARLTELNDRMEFERSLQFFKASPATIAERQAPAFDRLLAKFGVSRNDDWDTLIAAFKRMADGLSERYKEVLQKHARECEIE